MHSVWTSGGISPCRPCSLWTTVLAGVDKLASTSGETKSLRVPQVLHLSVWAILQSDFKALNIHHNEINQSMVYRSATAKYSTGNFWKQFLSQFPLQLQIETCS